MIDGLSMEVYQDGVLIGKAMLPRLVTDCTGDELELGQKGDARSHSSAPKPPSVHALRVGAITGRHPACLALITAS